MGHGVDKRKERKEKKKCRKKKGKSVGNENNGKMFNGERWEHIETF